MPILWNLKEQLRKSFGHSISIETFENGKDALLLIEEINQEKAELPVVICDQVMPGLNGDEFLIALHKTNPKTKKIMLTGQASAEAVGRVVNECGLYRFLPKPWDASDLELTIKGAIESFEKEKDLELKNLELEFSLYYNSESGYPNFQNLIRRLRVSEEQNDSISLALIKVGSFENIIRNFGINIYHNVLNEFLKILFHHLSDFCEIYHTYQDEIAVVTNRDESLLIEEVEVFQLLAKSEDLVVQGVSFRLQTFSASATGKEDAYYKAKIALIKAEGQLSKNTLSFDAEHSIDHHNENIQTGIIITQAIQEKNIIPFYQAIYDNRTNSIYKYECLARIRGKEGFLSPGFFLHLAKATGAIRMIGLNIIDLSMKNFSDKTFEFSLNLTEAELEYKNFSKWVEGRLSFYKIEPKRVTFEILEDISFSESINSITTIKELKEIGCLIAIDDFGVKHSNLSRLLEIDPDFIKIDGQFIKILPENKTALLLVQGIVALSNRIGAKVVAEFVSKQEIQDIILSLGIEFSQGYLFAEPLEKI